MQKKKFPRTLAAVATALAVMTAPIATVSATSVAAVAVPTAVVVALVAPTDAQAGLILSEISTGQAVAAPWYTVWWQSAKSFMSPSALMAYMY